MTKLVVYSMNGCAQCVQVSQLLKAKNVTHTVVKVDEDEEAYSLFKEFGHRSVPQVYLIEDAYFHIGDYKTLKNFTDEQFTALKNNS